MLYFMAGMPTSAQLLRVWMMASMSRSRSGLWASMIEGRRSRSMWLDSRKGATWFPIYLVQERGMKILEAGFAAAAPALAGFIGGLAGGVISDRILKSSGDLTVARKAPLIIGMLIATAIIACNYVSEPWLVLTIMAVAFFGKGIASLGWAVVSDTSPKELAGVTGGVFNTLGNTAGIITPIVIGYIVAATGSFKWGLVYVGAHCIVAILAYLVVVPKITRLQLKAA